MTQVRDRRGRERDTRTSQRRNTYLDLLRTPGALAFSAAGFVGRMSMSMYGLGTVLLIALLTGRYGEAGTVAAVGSIGYAVFGPVIATRADRLGQRRVLVAQTVVFTFSSAVFITCAELQGSVLDTAGDRDRRRRLDAICRQHGQDQMEQPGRR